MEGTVHSTGSGAWHLSKLPPEQLRAVREDLPQSVPQSRQSNPQSSPHLRGTDHDIFCINSFVSASTTAPHSTPITWGDVALAPHLGTCHSIPPFQTQLYSLTLFSNTSRASIN